MDGGQNIQVEWSTQRLGLAWTSRLAIAAEVDRQNAKSCRRQSPCLLPPTFLVKSAAVGQHDAAVTISLQIGVDGSPVRSSKGNVLLRRNNPS